MDRASLLKAVSGLPAEDDDSWTVPEAVLAAVSADAAEARRHVLTFSAWARDAISHLPEVPREEMQATDFSDYYKVVMSRVQFIYGQATHPHEAELRFPACRFQTQLRRRPQFIKDGATCELGVFDGGPNSALVGSFEESKAAFCAALRLVGQRRFEAQSLWAMLEFAVMEESLQPVNEAWVSRLAGAPLFEMLDEGADFSAGDTVQVKLVLQDGQVVLLAQGPWFKVTFAETSILQCMAQFMTERMVEAGDQDGVGWCRNALMTFAVSAHCVQERVHATRKGLVTLFAGRRAPHPELHALQHMYLAQLWPGFATSSLFAARVLPGVQLAGTWAHEGPMAFMALESQLDARLPISSVLWTLLFWASTSNCTVLSDGFGSATYKHMLADLGLLADVTMARQDSGALSRYAAIWPDTRRMASEIENYADIAEAMRCGFEHFGAGGFFGEKRRGVVEFSIAAKITTAFRRDASGAQQEGHAGKLGDMSGGSGSWADFSEETHGAKARAKFIVPLGADPALRDSMFGRMKGWAAAGDAMHDRTARGLAASPLLVRADAARLAARLREIAGADSMGACAKIRGALLGYAARVDAAAAALPETLPMAA